MNATGSTRVPVYLHLTSDRAARGGNGDDERGAELEGVHRVLHRVVEEG